ncbi:hypothetical protein EBS43_12065 [bacterium]|jgi:hypothetical protein|nr:hypothetical protein [bacterium]
MAKTLIILASAGAHCSDGQNEGADLIRRLLNAGRDPLRAAIPGSDTDFMRNSLDTLREQIFAQVMKF